MRIRVPGDKSISHRALLLASLARGSSEIRGLLPSADPLATAAILRSCGVRIPDFRAPGSVVRIGGVGLRGLRSPPAAMDCENSGTTARLLLGMLSPQPVEVELRGDASLLRRPMRRVTEPLSRMGADLSWVGEEGFLPIRVRGRTLAPLDWESPVASAQVKSALLLAGLCGGVPVSVTEPLRSRDHTERMFAQVGIRLREEGAPGGWKVSLADPPGHFEGFSFEVPGDPSSALFMIALSLLVGTPVELPGVGLNPTRTAFLEVLARMGARLGAEVGEEDGGERAGTLTVDGGTLRAVEIGPLESPLVIDELPILVALAARAEGTTRVSGATELRVKESDRIRAMVEGLRAVGVEAREFPDGLEVEGTDRPLKGRVRTFGDHRIAMAFGVLGATRGSAIDVDDPGCVDVSFPGFWELRALLREQGEGVPGRSGSTASAPVPRTGPVITIDGPAGSGKSSTAREVSRRLGIPHLDSGALYRALTFSLLERGIPEGAWDRLEDRDLEGIPLRMELVDGAFRILLGDRALTDELRSGVVTAGVSRAAAIPAIRRRLLGLQRAAAGESGLVADGRDMGSTVFPEATLKVFMTADLEERARRRLAESGRTDPAPDEVGEEMERIRERDRQDASREASPLIEPAGALRIDTTRLDFEAQVSRIVEAASDGGPA